MAYKNTIQILSAKRMSKDPIAWLRIEFIDDKGQQRSKIIKDQACANLVTTVPGHYEMTTEASGEMYQGKKIYEVTGMKFLYGNSSPSQAAVDQAEQKHNQEEKCQPQNIQPQRPVDPNSALQNRSISNQVCVKASAEVTVAALAAGAFIVKKEDSKEKIVDVLGMADFATTLARSFMAEMKTIDGEPKEVNPKEEEVPF